MKKTSRLMTVLGIGGLVAGGLWVTTSASAVTSAPVSTSTNLTASADVVRQSASAVQLSTSGGASTTVVSAALGAGSWVLSSNATLVGWGPSDYTRCSLYSGNTVLGGATTMIGNPASGAGSGTYVATVSVHGSFTSSTSTTVELRCGHDTDRAAGSAPYVDPQATLWAHQTDSLRSPR